MYVRGHLEQDPMRINDSSSHEPSIHQHLAATAFNRQYSSGSNFACEMAFNF